MFKRFKFIFILSLPLLCKYFFLLLFIDWNLFDFQDVIEDMLFFLFIVLLFIIKPINKQYYTDFVCFIYVLYVILETTSYMAVSSNFSSSYMYLLIESNTGELREFISSYINTPIIIFVILSCVLFFVIRKIHFFNSNKYYSLFATIGLVSIIVFLKLTGLIESNVYHNIVRGTYGYIDLQKSIKFNSDIKKEDLNVISDNEVLVVILGESTARGHMQLYGYNRKTSPFLNALKDSLFIYNNVISTDVITTKSVPKILTSIDNTSINNVSTNIIEVFNKAGFKTYWLSNQRPIGYYDNQISKIASFSNYLKFMNHVNETKTTSYDEVLFPEFNKVLSQKGNKVVFIRLIGTHFEYDKRYPLEFNKFSTNFSSTKKERIINFYDNAVLYNDFVVSQFIRELQKHNKKSALLYMSDHGENVYDEGTNFFGRPEENLTKSMFEIPFLLWTSNSFEFPKDFDYEPNRMFMADHTYESIGHIFGVMHKSMNTKNSIFSKSFKPRRRKVVNNIDFDSFFLESNE
jgi:heptose-I-phosphate ethanolaminephosphotransferase